MSNEDLTQLKFSDFGTAIRLSDINDPIKSDNIGTPFYMAPEVFKGVYNAKCDVWSLGIMLFKMLTGIFPFPGDTEE